jgi:DNA segregation ATPase FtsK/SpoIIIE, S-DNA-T family
VSKHLTVSQTAELLHDLKRAAREFADREEKLTREFRAKTELAQKRLKQDLETLEAEAAAKLTEATELFQTRSAELQRRNESRKTRIGKAYQTSNRQGFQRVEQLEGRKKYPIQKGLLDTKRNREDLLKRNDAALGEFHGELAANREVFVQLEGEAYRSLRGYGSFRRMLRGLPKLRDPNLNRDEHALLAELNALQDEVRGEIAQFRRSVAPKLFAVFPLAACVALIAIGAAALPFLLQNFGNGSLTYPQAGIAGAALITLLVVAHTFSRQKAAARATKIAESLETARRLHNASIEKSSARHAEAIQQIELEAKRKTEEFEAAWQRTQEEMAHARATWPQALADRGRRVAEKHETLSRARTARLKADHESLTSGLEQETARRQQRLTAASQEHINKLTAQLEADWQEMQHEWEGRVQPVYERLSTAQTAAKEFSDWSAPEWQSWTPPHAFINAAKFGQLDVDAQKFCEVLPKDSRLALPGPSRFAAPLVLHYPQEGSLLFETTKSGNESVLASINNLILRLLASSPAGKVSFTLIDPVRLGQSFAAVMHLTDFEDNLISGRIWTQPTQIEEQLAHLNEHMEKVIQMYLRNEYATIAEYNAEAGNIAEKYHFVVIADFPANFTQTAVRRLQRIAASGARCGVFMLIHWDQRQTPPPDFLPEELRKSSVCVTANGAQLELTQPAVPRANVILDSPPAPDFATQFLQKVGEASRGSNRVEVPFEQVSPAPAEVWSLQTTDELRVPIGRSGATKLQYLAIGKGTRQHALIAGKTGSGKSTLFHVMITNLAQWCSPEQVEFYLVDFKKGVEFKGYAARRLPHARVVAIESDREFGLSVLQRVDEELKRRGDLFRKLGVQDLAGYKRAGGHEPLPRSLLLIDEFQEFFVEDDRISQAANVLLDRIVRQGRAFGIHVLLGSQTLGGAYTLARTTIGQMVIRIALQCNEADAYLIMDENNAAPRLLSRPGEGIYNDMTGATEGNSPFQAVWLSDEERDARLREIRARADATTGTPAGPIVFEGNAPADVRDNEALRVLLAESGPASRPRPVVAKIWLGAPNAIKGPTEAAFTRRSGNNLLIVGQRDEAILAILSLGVVALAAQYAARDVRIIYFESLAPGSAERGYLEHIFRAKGPGATLASASDLARVIGELADDLQQRTDSDQPDAPETFLIIHGLQNFKKLRQDEDFAFSMDDKGGANVAAQFQKLVSEGPSHGMHVVASVDTFNNVNRFIGRKGLSEFEMRVLFQMSANDSASLCDDPKASALGLHRALFYNEQEGYLETFRPYALPSPEWVGN